LFPTLLTTPWFQVPTYGVMLALSYLVAIEVGVRKAEAAGEDPEKLSTLVTILILGAFAGGRALFVWLEWPLYADNFWRILDLREGGLVFFGGLAGAFFSCLVYVLYAGIRPFHMADYAMGSVALGQAIGRIGCLGVGCCYGSAWEGPWAIELHGAMRHPVQLYASLSLFLFWLGSEWTYRRWHQKKPGIILVLYLYFQAGHRYLMETFRSDPRGGTFHLGMSISQEIAVILGMTAVLLHLVLARWLWTQEQVQE
jgi:phosphatidylglycerol:prolipoprotein diacylglycerol transferase